MRRAGRRRTINAVGLSVAVHVVLLTALALHAPRLTPPRQSSGPPEPIIPVLIAPRTPPPEAGGPPTPIRLHRRPQRFAPRDLPVEPLLVPEAPPPRSAPAARRVVTPPEDDAVAANVQRALRARLGCDSPSLSRAERQACEDRLAAGARDAPFLGLGVDRDKVSDLARAAAQKEATANYRRAAPTPPSAPGAGGSGVSATEMGAAMGNDRPALKVPF